MVLHDLLKSYNVILASDSPRRKQLLKEMGVQFSIAVSDIEEVYPAHLPASEVAAYISKIKADSFKSNILKDNDIIITADTVVALDGKIIPKPYNIAEAKKFLQKLSNKMHIVYTGITIKSKNKEKTFYEATKVYFKKFTKEEIDYYITKYKPLDKAGAYGIQEWIGYIGVEHIEGSFFNVIGLPTAKLYDELVEFVNL